MADGTQQPLLQDGAQSPSTTGDPVRSSHGQRFLSWFRRFIRERKPPPSPTAAAPPPVSPESLAAAAAAFAEEAERGSPFVEEAKSFADAAQAFAEAEEPRASRFSDDLKERASALAVAADLLLQHGMPMSASATGLAVKALKLSMDSQVLLPGFALLAASPPEENFADPEEGSQLQSLLHRAREFSTDASGTTMDVAAKGFYQAAQAFAYRDRNYEKVREIPLNQAAMNLSIVASMVPPEDKLAVVALKLASDASALLLGENNTPLVKPPILKVKKCTCMQWLFTCISGPTLPLHRHEVKRQEKLAEKRQVIFGICLNTPIAILTTMKAGSVLPPEHTAWVGGISASIWVLVNAGFMLSLYGKTDFEICAAQHLSRLGMLGVAILVCAYMYWWFFPSVKMLFWTLIGFVTIFHCILWLLGCWRHDDDIAFTSPAEEECMCSRCRPCSCACGGEDLESSGRSQVQLVQTQ